MPQAFSLGRRCDAKWGLMAEKYYTGIKKSHKPYFDADHAILLLLFY